MDEIDPDPTPAGWSNIFSSMEVLTSNESNAVEEGVKFNLSGIGITSDLENMALESILNSSCTESIGAPIILDNEESMKVNMKRKTFEGVENGPQSPLKKLNSGPSPDALNANLDSSLDNLSSANTTDAMIIDTPSLVTGDREVDKEPYPSGLNQISGTILSCTTNVRTCIEESIQVPLEGSRKTDRLEILKSADCNVECLEMDAKETINHSSHSVGTDFARTQTEVVTLSGFSNSSNVHYEREGQVFSSRTEEDSPAILVNKNNADRVSKTETPCPALHVAGNERVEEICDVAEDLPAADSKPSPPKVLEAPLSFSSVSVKELSATESGGSNIYTHVHASEVLSATLPDSPKIHSDTLPLIQGCERPSVDQSMALESLLRLSNMEVPVGESEHDHSRDVHATTVSHVSGDPKVLGSNGQPASTEGVSQSDAMDDGADNESGISEVDEVVVEKADVANPIEDVTPKDSTQSLVSEKAEGVDNGMHSLLLEDDFGLDEHQVDKDVNLNGLSGDEHPAELMFEIGDELPEPPEGPAGLHSGSPDTEELSNGKVSDDLHLNQERQSSKQGSESWEVVYPCNNGGEPNKDHECPLESGSDNVQDSLDRQESEVATPSAATSAQSQSSGLKLRLKLKGPTDTPLKEAPGSAKHLLSSGLLEGHHVRYLGRGGLVMLTGIIQDGGILCDCRACKGLQTVNVSAFEKHAGSSARHPSDFIFLENGKCLKDILEVGWNATKLKLNILEVLKDAIGEIRNDDTEKVNKKPKSIDLKLRASLDTKSRTSLDLKPRLSIDTKPRFSLDTKSRVSLDTKSRGTEGRAGVDTKARLSLDSKSRGTEGRATLVREGSTREKEPPISVPLSRETSGANLHKALFLPGGLSDDCELGYYVKGQKFLAGVKKGAGICCSCCQQVISCSLFEQHAGWGSRRNPYSSIYLADGRSLHEAAQSLVVAQHIVKQEGDVPTKLENLDYCNECGEGGDILLCSGCPTAYHQDCLGSSAIPTGDFFCPDCQQQRFGGIKDRRRALVKRRVKGASKTLLTKDRITGRCTRLLQVPEAVTMGGCVFCKSGDFAKSGFGPMTTLLCDQCEREYHVGCLKKHGLEDLKELPEGEWFCGQDCKHIHSILSLLVANGPEPLADSIISQVLESKQRHGKPMDEVESGTPAFEWQLLHGRGGDPVNGKTLAEAVQIFSMRKAARKGLHDVIIGGVHLLGNTEPVDCILQECFDPIVDGMSGGDLIPLMVYRRSIRDQEFGGIYCVVLKQNDKVVSTALIRIFGRQLAELPLLATSIAHQGQGHCKALLLSIERLLGVLRVERLALPAAEGAEGIWTNKFQFVRMPDLQVQQFQAELNMMVFTGSNMLEKDIAPLEICQC